MSKLILPKGFESKVNRTTSTHYTQISSDRIVLTAVTRAELVDYVPPYNYRETLARSRQLVLRQVVPEDVPPDNAKLYALLVYGGPHALQFPTIAQIVFPNSDGKIRSDGVSLLAEHPAVVQKYIPAEEQLVAAVPKLRKRANVAGE